MADLYKKQNTDVKIGVKLMTEEVDYLRKFPREKIVVSGNENRVPVLLNRPVGAAAIADGGNEARMAQVAPTHGTFLPTIISVRHGFTGLAQAYDTKSRSAMIQNQIDFQTMTSVYKIGRAVGLQFYGQSTGTISVVKTTGSASATQVVAIKNAFGSSTFSAGGDLGPQDTYNSNIAFAGEVVALIRAGAIVEFGTITAAPSATSGIGYIDVLFNSSITPTANDLIVLANADGDNTISGTDVNNWSYGWTEILTASQFMGINSATYPYWLPGSTATASQRLSFAVKERMINETKNASGYTPNRFIIDQGVRRNAISGLQGGRRYDGPDVDLEGDLKPGDGEQFMGSQLTLPGTMIGYFNNSVSMIELSDMPDDGAGRGVFKLDKVQGKSQIAAYYEYIHQKICSSRSATAYATNLTSS